nr:hypothetical protein [Desulfobulbaceae bacterium]
MVADILELDGWGPAIKLLIGNYFVKKSAKTTSDIILCQFVAGSGEQSFRIANLN